MHFCYLQKQVPDNLSSSLCSVTLDRILHLSVPHILPLYMLSRFSHIRLCATLWTVARQAPLSMGLSRQEYLSGLSCPPPEDLPDPGIEPSCLISPLGQAGSLPQVPPDWANNGPDFKGLL